MASVQPSSLCSVEPVMRTSPRVSPIELATAVSTCVREGMCTLPVDAPP